jgi:hypothetical protein
MRIFALITLALFLGAGAASAWEEYNYLDKGVAIQFPNKPQAMKSTYDSTLAKGLLSMIYSAEDDHVLYRLTVVDLTSHPDVGANFLNEAAYELMREGDVLFTDFPRVYQGAKAIYGVSLVVDRMDGSRVRTSLYYNKGRLYIADAVVLPARRSLRATSRIPTSKQADQRAEAINCATPYPPRMTAAKLPATTARRKAAVMAYSMGSPQIKSAPSRAKKVGGKIRPHQVQPGMTLDMPL